MDAHRTLSTRAKHMQQHNEAQHAQQQGTPPPMTVDPQCDNCSMQTVEPASFPHMLLHTALTCYVCEAYIAQYMKPAVLALMVNGQSLTTAMTASAPHTGSNCAAVVMIWNLADAMLTDALSCTNTLCGAWHSCATHTCTPLWT